MQANKKASVPTILRSIAKIIPSSACTTQCTPSVDAHARGAQEVVQESARQHAKEGDKGGRRRGGTCDSCGIERAAVKRPKDGARVCKACFYELFEDEVHQTIVDGKLFSPGESVCVAASGGKDSTVLAEMMTVLNKRHNYGLKLFLLSIDEGISGYRDDSLETVKRNQIEYNLPLTILSYKDLYGWTMDEIVSHIGTTSNCTFCGVFRRQALDRGAALLKADKIVTGHNADDVAETVLLNILRGDVARLQRCTAVTTGSDGSIPRSKPFKFTVSICHATNTGRFHLDRLSTSASSSARAIFLCRIFGIGAVRLPRQIFSCLSAGVQILQMLVREGDCRVKTRHTYPKP